MYPLQTCCVAVHSVLLFVLANAGDSDHKRLLSFTHPCALIQTEYCNVQNAVRKRGRRGVARAQRADNARHMRAEEAWRAVASQALRRGMWESDLEQQDQSGHKFCAQPERVGLDATACAQGGGGRGGCVHFELRARISASSRVEASACIGAGRPVLGGQFVGIRCHFRAFATHLFEPLFRENSSKRACNRFALPVPPVFTSR